VETEQLRIGRREDVRDLADASALPRQLSGVDENETADASRSVDLDGDWISREPDDVREWGRVQGDG
jgi:hypothetical protein